MEATPTKHLGEEQDGGSAEQMQNVWKNSWRYMHSHSQFS